jgi:DNA-binding beta-propeller fold protein YncE
MDGSDEASRESYTLGIMTRLTSCALTLLFAVTAAPVLAQTGPYKILSTTKVGGEGGFDYLNADSEARRLYIARSGPAGNLHVYDLDTLKELGEVPTGSAHGAAIDTALHHGFATSKPVTMFDTETLQVIKKLPTEGNPDGYLVDPVAHRVYVLSHVSPNITVLDAHDGAIVGTLDVGGAVEQAQLDGKGKLFVDLEDKDAIAVVDVATLKLVGKYDISSKGGGCAGLGMDTKNGVLFASCRDKNNMIIVNAATGKILDALPIGVGSDGAGFDPETMEAFSTQGDGTLTVIKESSPTSFAVEQVVKTPVRARTMTLDTKLHHVLTMTGEFTPAPAPVAGQKPGRPTMVPGSFEVIVVGK